MSRNLKREYIKKLFDIKTSNGYKVDVANYVYNPNYSHEYPNLVKTVGETEQERHFSVYRYFKHYDGSGCYEHETHTAQKDGKTWVFCKNVKTEQIEESARFSMKRLIELAEQEAGYEKTA